jgi:hypothetical protein
VKLADAFITEVTKPVIEEEKETSPSVPKVTPGIPEETPGNEENKAIEDALKTS